MEGLSLNIPHYPMLRFLARHGRSVVSALAGVLLVVGVVMAVVLASTIAGIAVIVAAVLVFVVGRALVEMVQLITDMLLPK